MCDTAGKVTAMSRFFVRSLLVIGALFVLACLGQAVPIQFVFFLIAGWIHYLYRVVPHVQVDPMAAATSAVCLILLSAGVHWFASWLYPHIAYSPDAEHARAAPRWRARWTAWLIGGVLLMFIAGLASVGVTHQVGWLLMTPEKLVISAGAREAAWRAQSTNNLKQIGLALYNYHQQHNSFPPAGTFDPRGRPMHGWLAEILPFIEEPDLYGRIDFQIPWNDTRNAAPYQTKLNVYLRPGIDMKKDAAGYALSHYAANAAMLGGNVQRTLQNVSDGTSNTIMAGEVASNFKPWGDPTNWRDLTLGVNQSPNGFGSISPGGANFLFVDGSVHFVRNTIKSHVLKALSTPAGGDEVSLDQY
jgi:prepilin-type processing-associated H-X9-DG protein